MRTQVTISSAIGSLRYQVLTPSVTTFGHCVGGCGAHARGAGLCAQCIVDAFDGDTHTHMVALKLVLETQHRAAMAAEMLIDQLMAVEVS